MRSRMPDGVQLGRGHLGFDIGAESGERRRDASYKDNDPAQPDPVHISPLTQATSRRTVGVSILTGAPAGIQAFDPRRRAHALLYNAVDSGRTNFRNR